MLSTLHPMIDAVATASTRYQDAPSLESVFAMADVIHPEMSRLSIKDGDLPWGRYLIHHDPEDRFNIQLDVFSQGYTGSCHAHGAWGAFWVLRGQLRAWDYTLVKGRPTVSRYGLFGAGGFQCFAPPLSDWHKVGTPEGGAQTVSIHIYGPGFDMDVGETLGDDGTPKSYRRSAFKDIQLALPSFTRR